MHPEILRMMTDQHGREMRARARQARLARMVRSARRGRAQLDRADGFVLPRIPDYVDGSFRTGSASAAPAQGQAASGAGRAAAGQRAA